MYAFVFLLRLQAVVVIVAGVGRRRERRGGTAVARAAVTSVDQSWACARRIVLQDVGMKSQLLRLL